MDETIDEILVSDDLKNIIMSIANKFYNVEKKDLYQVGYIGAIKAYNNYSVNCNVKFTTFAYKYIFGEMYELAKNNRNIKLNKKIVKLYKDIERVKILLTQKFNKEPSLDSISRYLEVDISLINDCIITCSNTISLDNESEMLNDSNLYTMIGETPNYDNKILINSALEYLSEIEKKVIDYRYFYGYSQQEIANILGINQVKVSRLETSSKKKIKEYICA